MGFLDRAKKLTEQAKGLASDLVERRRADEDAPSGAGPAVAPGGAGPAVAPGDDLRVRWISLELPDPAAVLGPKDREPHDLPRSTKSEVVQERHGVGRRWSVGDRSLGLLWLVEPGANPPNGAATSDRWQAMRDTTAADVPGVGEGAYLAEVGGGRRGVFVRAAGVGFVLEAGGIDDEAAIALARQAATKLGELRG